MNVPFSHDAKVTNLDLADIGGTHAETGWVLVSGFERIFARVEIGTWDAGDDLDECRLEQATSAAGAGAKDLTTDASGGNYDTDNPVDADGDFVILEANASDLDTENGFKYVRLYTAEGGNTGPDFVSGVLIVHGAQNKHPQQEGAAVTGSKVYVRPS